MCDRRLRELEPYTKSEPHNLHDAYDSVHRHRDGVEHDHIEHDSDDEHDDYPPPPAGPEAPAAGDGRRL